MNKLLLPIHLVILLCSLAGCVAGEIPESPGSTTTPSVVLSSPDPIREPSPSVEDTVVVTTETVATSDAVEQPTLCVPTILSVALDDLSPLYLRWKPQSSTLYLQVNTPKDEVWELDTLSSKLTPSRDFSVLVDPKIAERLIGLVPANAIQPTLAPTGDKLVYVTRIFTKPTPTADPEGITIKDREFLFDIHIITADNPAIPTVFRAEGSPRKLIWSKDGEYLLVQMFAEFPTPSPLIILDTKSKDLEPVVSNEYADFVSVSPNAVNILYNTNGGTIALNTQTDQKTQLSI